MQNQRLAVNCLVQVKTDNRLDFEEWLNYHIALGFDTIFVCDKQPPPAFELNGDLGR